MFKNLNISYWFIGGLIIWGIIALLRRNGIIVPLNDHLTDLYSVPMFSYTTMKIMKLTYYPDWRPDLKFLLGAALNLTIVFEIICPLLSARYTADFMDIICYFSGALIYHLVLQRIYYVDSKLDMQIKIPV